MEVFGKTINDLVLRGKKHYGYMGKYSKFGVKLGFSVFGCIILRYIIIKLHRKYKKYPNGIVGFPYIGVLPYFILNDFYYLYSNVLPKYGSLTMYTMGKSKFVTINDPETARKIFVSKDKQDTSVFYSQLGKWNESNKHRNHWGSNYRSVKHLRLLMRQDSISNEYLVDGIKNILNKLIYTEIDKNSEPKNVKTVFNPLTFSLIVYAILGIHINDLNDPFYKEFRQESKNSMQKIVIKILKLQFNNEQLTEEYHKQKGLHWDMNKLKDIIIKYIELNKSEVLSKKDSLYNKLKLKIDDDFTEDDLLFDIASYLFVALDSTLLIMRFVIVCLGLYKNIQSEICKELSNNGIKNENDLQSKIFFQCIRDKKLSTLQSFVWEVLRMYPVASANNPRRVVKTFEINGFKIPKNWSYSINIYACNLNKQSFGNDADKFNINHFKNNNGEYISSKNIMTFGCGARTCPGMNLAIKEAYLLTALLVLRYNIKIDTKKALKQFGIKSVNGLGAPFPEPNVLFTKK